MLNKNEALQVTKTLLTIFISSALAAFIVLGINIFDVTLEGWKGIAGAAIASVVVSAFNFLNPRDIRYGIGAKKNA